MQYAMKIFNNKNAKQVTNYFLKVKGQVFDVSRLEIQIKGRKSKGEYVMRNTCIFTLASLFFSSF